MVLGIDPVDVALKYKNLRETRPNRSKEIDEFNKPFGNIGGPYCATGVAHCLKESGCELPKGSALARNYYRRGYKTYSADDVLNGKVLPKRNDIGVWGKGNTLYGHCGFVVEYDPETGIFTMFEFNTSGTSTGSQSNGDGAHLKKRKIEKYAWFRLIGFSKVKKTTVENVYHPYQFKYKFDLNARSYHVAA